MPRTINISGTDLLSRGATGRIPFVLWLIPFIFLSCGAGILLCRPASGRAISNSNGPLFRDFNGVVLLPGRQQASELGLGWAREGFYWNVIEPKKGVWNWIRSDQVVLGGMAEGVQILPLLGYNAPWDESLPKGAPHQGFSPPKNVQDWEDYVEHVVSRYTQPPYNVHYFQVWNEPTRQAGFWTGTDQEFVDKVYLPAAKIIRSHGGRVVFGGWPASNSVQEFDSVLAYHEAWRWTDILDVHYEGFPYFQYLYNHWVKTGKCQGIWETELGFTPDPSFIPVNYLQILNWALSSGWSDPNQYKLFWYAAWGAGPDGERCFTKTDGKGNTVLSSQGKRLAVLNQLLGPGSLSAFSDYRVTSLPANSWTYGFKNGRRIVIPLFLSEPVGKGVPPVTVRVPMNQKPGGTQLLTEDGEPLKPGVSFGTGQLSVTIPSLPSIASKGGGKLAILYLQIDPR